MAKELKHNGTQLFLLLKEQNENAYSFLYDRYAPLLYGIILGQVKNEKLASEILKSAFINISNECRSIDCIKQSLFVWLLALTKKTAATDFQINIDLKSMLRSQKVKSEDYGFKTPAHVEKHTSASSYLNLNATV